MTSSNKNNASISAPASSANLGPGFDCLALALDLRLKLKAEWSDEKVARDPNAMPAAWWDDHVAPHSKFEGELAGFSNSIIEMPPNLIGIAFQRVVEKTGGKELPAKLAIECTSDIKIGQGLGSSAAAIMAGAALGTIWLKGEYDRALALEAALEVEGHPDNICAALDGGLQAAIEVRSGLRPRRLAFHDSLNVAVAVPEETLKDSTDATRHWLPEQLKRTDAVTNQRTLLTLLYGLETGDEDALHKGFDDMLHVPHRKGMIQGFDQIVQAARDNGALGATISGAGGSVIAFGKGDMGACAKAMKDAYQNNDMRADGHTPNVADAGLKIE